MPTPADWTLRYFERCPFNVGDIVQSPVSDDTGKTLTFEGFCVVVESGVQIGQTEDVFFVTLMHTPPS